jgi:inner membrane protein involved in colicin E2 resistance
LYVTFRHSVAFKLIHIALISTEIFWYLIEATVALLAVCLPTLSGLRRAEPVERAIRSVQSKLSLRSNTSGGAKPVIPLQEIPVTEPSRVSHSDRKSKEEDSEKIGVLPEADHLNGGFLTSAL